MNRLAYVLAAVLLSLATTAASAQELPESLESQSTRLQGDQITFCLDRTATGAGLDEKVGQAIADALLVKAAFTDAPTGFPLDAGGYLAELKIVMANKCDVLLGISLQPNFPYPDWATPTRPYATVPFVLAVTNKNYKSLADIPRDKLLGTALGSIGEYNFITYSLQQPENQRWRRLPYADPNLMLKRVKDGTLAGMILWQPSLLKITAGDPVAAGLRVIPADPVPASSVQIAALVSSRDSFLRSQIDEAIGSLVSDGTIQSLLDQTKFQGRPG
jgi:polar amino acid transport system substrate-binding protein